MDSQPLSWDPHDNVVCVLGMECRFPDGDSLEGFWSLLLNGRHAEFRGGSGTKQRFVEGTNSFDHHLFDMSAHESGLIDPQHRVLLEVTWLALEQANIPSSSLRNSDTCVFVGISNNHFSISASNSGSQSPFLATGASPAFSAGRLSHFFGFRGTSLSIDTTSSSSLTAVHLAAERVRSGHSQIAISAGINLLGSDPELGSLDIASPVLSSDGYCRSFDFRASGIGRSEGCGVIILGKKSKATNVKGILPIIVGSESRHDGRSSTMTSPNGISQEETIRGALQGAQLSASDVQVVEAHGTGTEVGDSIELQALKNVYGGNRKTPLIIGSVKTNIGHTEASAGIAGMIKLILSLKHGTIPPHLHFESYPGNFPDLGSFPAMIPTTAMRWKQGYGGKARVGGVSSFGMSGTNVHILVSEIDFTRGLKKNPAQKSDLLLPPFFSISAKTKSSLLSLARKYVTMLDGLAARGEAVQLEDLCFSAFNFRNGLGLRIGVAVETAGELREYLSSICTSDSNLKLIEQEGQHQIGFLFSGQENLSMGIGKQLWDHFEVFRKAMNDCDQIINLFLHKEVSIMEVMWNLRDSLNTTLFTQLALFSFQYSLASLWISFGVFPVASFGHSLGECVAACISGVFSLHDALKFVTKRATLMDQVAHMNETGSMVAIEAPPSSVLWVLESYLDEFLLKELDVAAVNSPTQVVISGSHQAIDAAVQIARSKKIRCKILQTSNAFHSFKMDPILRELTNFVDTEITVSSPKIPFASNVTGQLLECGALCGGRYWSLQARSTVRFNSGIRALSQSGIVSSFLDNGPTGTVTNILKKEKGLQCFRSFDPHLLARGEVSSLLPTMFQLSRIDSLSRGQLISVPRYSFNQHEMNFSTCVCEKGMGGHIHKETHVMKFNQKKVRGSLVDVISKVIHQVSGRVCEPSNSFESLGIDSMMSIDISNLLSSRLGIELSSTAVFDHPTIPLLSNHIQSLFHPRLEVSKAAIDAPRPQVEDEIVVIGMECQFPSASNLQEFWKTLINPAFTQHDISQRFGKAWDSHCSSRPVAMISDIECFDHLLFDITKNEALSMDPQQRLLLEISWRAFEQAGIPFEKLTKSSTGVFVGYFSEDFEYVSTQDQKPYQGTGTWASAISGRISHFFGLNGPSISFNTACSSSLVAIHEAANSLRLGQSSLALAAGVNLVLGDDAHLKLINMNALSPSGHCQTFDAAADGYLRGEGCGVVILGRGSDYPNYLAAILGSSVNHDGRTNNLNAPCGPAQELALRSALQAAKISPNDVQAIEAHGTGTLLGDPIEMKALQAVYGGESRRSPLVISSVKTNIGHSEAAAGVAGMIRLILSLKFYLIPPHLHFKAVNPHMCDLGQFPAIIPITTMKWASSGQRRIGGVSSFGISGTNAHLLVAEAIKYPKPQDISQSETCGPSLFLISAKTKESLLGLACDYLRLFRGLSQRNETFQLKDLCFAAYSFRSQLSYRISLISDNMGDLTTQLQERLMINSESIKPMKSIENSQIIFAFSGQGAQYPQMGRGLYEAVDGFRKIVNECDATVAKSSGGVSLLRTIWISREEDSVLSTYETQVCLFELQYSLGMFWISLGVIPDLVIGHSIGEIAAACIGGVMTFHNAINLIVKRGKLMENLETRGKMIVLQWDVQELLNHLEETLSEKVLLKLNVAAVNSQKQIVLSGSSPEIETSIRALEQRVPGLRSKYLEVGNGFHSFLMNPILEEFECFVNNEIQLFPPEIPLLSSVTGEIISKGSSEERLICSGHYWATHIKSSVRFLSCLLKLRKFKPQYVIEIGPSRTLESLFQLHDFTYLPSLNRREKDSVCFLKGLGQLLEGIKEIHPEPFMKINRSSRNLASLLPSYCFQKAKFPLKGETSSGNQTSITSTEGRIPEDKPSQSTKNISPQAETSDEKESFEREALEVIKHILRDELQLKPGIPITKEMNFGSLGVDSIVGLQIGEKIGKIFGTLLSPTALFDYPTVGTLADYLVGSVYPEEKRSEELLKNEMSIGDAREPPEIQKEASGAFVIGFGCKFLDLEGPSELWRHLLSGEYKRTLLPQDRTSRKFGVLKGLYGNFLKDVEKFDNVLFDIQDSEAGAMDPQQRLVLEMTWQALESTNIRQPTFQKAKTSVFLGMGSSEYAMMCYGSGKYGANSFSMSGTVPSIAAGRISHFFGFHGPSLIVGTTCSASLVAIHLGMASLRKKECDYAIVGGVNLTLSTDSTMVLQGTQALSPDGICHTFDASANGYARGEGCGILVLTQSREGLKQSPSAEILASAINHDGRATSLTSPNGPSQERVLREALRNAHVLPEDVQAIEAHGTGTQLGDSIEMRALGSVYGGRDRRSAVVISSIKTSIGHTELASGVASLIKIILSLNHAILPPQLHFKTANPHLIDLGKFPCLIPVQPMRWRKPPHKRRIGALSSFGISGTNAHMIISEVSREKGNKIELNPLVEGTEKPFIFGISGATKKSVLNIAKKYKQMIDGVQKRGGLVQLADLCFSAITCRNHLKVQIVFAARSIEDLKDNLKNVIKAGVSANMVGDSYGQGIAMVFSGQGNWYTKMGDHLYERFSTYREIYDQCKDWIQRTGTSFGEQLETFIVEYSLGQLWLSFGITPSVVMGHSLGEFAAACLVGVFCLEDGLKLVAKRAELMKNLEKRKDSETGVMVAVQIGSKELMKILEREMDSKLLDKLNIAGVNGPRQIVISGEQEAIGQATTIFAKQTPKVGFKFLNVSNGFHSFLMDPVISELEDFVKREVRFQNPHIPFISNVTGQSISSSENELKALQDGSYWGRHLRSTVRFLQGVERVFEKYDIGAVIECGPSNTLCGVLKSIKKKNLAVLVPSLHPKEAGKNSQQFEKGMADLIAHGFVSRKTIAEVASGGKLIYLPSYSFDRKSHWIVSPTKRISDDTTLDYFETKLVPFPNWSQFPLRNEMRCAIVFFLGDGLVLNSLLETAKFFGITLLPVRLNGSNSSKTDAVCYERPEDFEHIFRLHKEITEVIFYYQETEIHGRKPKEHLNVELENSTMLLFITQALLKSALKVKLTIVALSKSDIMGYIGPQRALFNGMARSIEKEAPQLNCRVLDLPWNWTESSIREKILEEIFSQGTRKHKYMQLRKGRWFVPQLSPVQSFDQMRSCVRRYGVYVVSGGLGGIGRVFCQWLVKRGVGHVVILSRRTKLDQNSIDFLSALSELGMSGVHVFSIDIGREDEVKALIETIEKKLGQIRGVLHLAGVILDAGLTHQSKEKFEKVFHPKIEGAWALHHGLLHHQLDWFVLASSISVFSSFGGQTNYAAANSYLDGFAEYRQERGLVGQSIQWGIWEGVGMSDSSGLKKMMKRKGALMKQGFSHKMEKLPWKCFLGPNRVLLQQR